MAEQKTPLDNFFYNQSLERYASLFSIVLSRLKIMSEGKYKVIPLNPASGRRFDQKNKTSNNHLPAATFTLTGDFEINKSVTNTMQNKLKTSNAVSKNRLPIVIPMEYNVRCKKRYEIFQILEQLYVSFYPSMDCRVTDNLSLQQDQNVKIKILSHQVSDNFEGEGEEQEFYECNVQFEVHGYLYGYNSWVKDPDGGGDDDKPAGVIETVIVQTSDDLKRHWSELDPWFYVDKDGTHHQN